MSSKTKLPEPDLPMSTDPEWTVVPVYKQPTKAQREYGMTPWIIRYELRFGETVQDKAATERGIDRLREIATVANRYRLIPRPRVQCAADTPNPENYLKSITP